MQLEVQSRPSAAVARIRLDRGETVTAEVGAMIAMDSGLRVNTTSRSRGAGGFLKSVGRMFSGESFFLNEFTATADGQELIIGPTLIGDVIQHRLDGGTVIVQGSSWLASGNGVEIDPTWQGFSGRGIIKSMFSGEGIFWIKCHGHGDLLLNSFGGIYEIEVNGRYVVDTGHIVAYEDTLDFRVGKASKSLFGSLLGGEGLVCKFEGQGKLYCQTHHPGSFGRNLGPKLRSR